MPSTREKRDRDQTIRLILEACGGLALRNPWTVEGAFLVALYRGYDITITLRDRGDDEVGRISVNGSDGLMW